MSATPRLGVPVAPEALVLPPAPGAAPPDPRDGDKNPALELSPTETGLASLRSKLERKNEELTRKGQETLRTAAALETEIRAFEALLPKLTAAVEAASADGHRTEGALSAMSDLIGRLRTPGVTNPVQGLEKLVVETQQHARQLAVELVGNFPYTDEFLRHPNLMGEGDLNLAIDQGRASGLVQAIKEDFIKKFRAAQETFRALAGELESRDPKYIAAENSLSNTRADLKQAESHRDDLLAQIRRALKTIEALGESIKRTDMVARTLEEEQRVLREGNIRTSDEALGKAQGEETSARDTLAAKKGEHAAKRRFIDELTQTSQRATNLLALIDVLLRTYDRATERLAQVPSLRERLAGVDRELSRTSLEASRGIDPALVTAGSSLHDGVTGVLGYGVGMSDAILDELRTNEETLRHLVTEFEAAVQEADAPVPDAQDFAWVACERVVALGEKLMEFLAAWEKLRGGSLERIDELSADLRERLDAALQPFDVLRDASGTIAELLARPQAPARALTETQRLPAPPAAPAAAAAPGAAPAPAATAEAGPPPPPELPRAPTPAPPLPAPAGDEPDRE